MVFGLIHSIFLLPIILAYIGPQYENDEKISTFQLNEQNRPPGQELVTRARFFHHLLAQKRDIYGY
jgi:hypothetical protein